MSEPPGYGRYARPPTPCYPGEDPQHRLQPGAGGQSAGGNLSAAVCLLDAERRELGLKALMLDYPPLDIHTDP